MRAFVKNVLVSAQMRATRPAPAAGPQPASGAADVSRSSLAGDRAPDAGAKGGKRNYRRLYRDEAAACSNISPPAVTWTILRQWLVIVATFVACTVAADRLLPFALQKADLQLAAASALGLLFVFAAGAFVMACKQHALGVIMHDATHYRLLNTKRFNDGVSDFFCAFPIGMVTASYRRGHLPHHAFTNKPLDPYWARLSQDEGYHFPMKRERLARLLVKDVLGLNFRTWWPILRAWTGWAFIFRDPEKFLSAKDRRRFTAFWAVVLAGAVASGLWAQFLLLWIVPMLTLNLAFTRIRVIAEHDLDKSDGELGQTRHVDGNWIERLAIGPLNINYHIAHHLFPMVPLYNLPKLHSLLMKDPDFRNDSQVWRRYLGKNGLIESLVY